MFGPLLLMEPLVSFPSIAAIAISRWPLEQEKSVGILGAKKSERKSPAGWAGYVGRR